MFSAFRPKATKSAPPPLVEIVGFDGETLELRSATPLPEGPATVILAHAELEFEQECQVHIDQGFPEKQLYWASLPAGSEGVATRLHALIPGELEVIDAAGEPAPTWEEKRSKGRLQRIIGVMSPQVEGFRCLSHDFHGDGMRLQLSSPLPVSSSIKLRFELEDHRLKPFDLIAEVRWCQENPYKGGHWAGLRFTQIEESQREAIDKFVSEVLAHEGGVLSRDYVGD